ncbi:Alpha/Beta hydrolase protein [Lipomyces tetrasporus]|uniref:Alpha/Beta hydrolase protein n=1 Tax=Lipomyces tetrasporus TaxID=54092 RepID=A0AAD7QNA9_9ASCO|nr:Alpha/Beta hydrolase protein [Lipomyces tetrasporus]KAJ8098434.1 Alpha/Beta hydrolase protein [Lipomyces tetrasporus]
MAYEKFELELPLKCGVTLPAFLTYKTLGDPKNPAVMIPTCYTGRIAGTMNAFIGDDDAVSPKKYFVIIVGLLGGSESSSPSNQPAPFDGPNFPKTIYEDNIHAQFKLMQHLGVEKLFCYMGYSMGGQQAYHFATLYPDHVQKIIPLASSAQTSGFNWNFLEGVKSTVKASSDFMAGAYTEPVMIGTTAFGRVYSNWALSYEWFKTKAWEAAGYKSSEDYVLSDWEKRLNTWDARDLLQMAVTWQEGDIAIYHDNDYAKALGAIKAEALVMPSRTDQYFRWEESVEEVKYLKKGKLAIIETVWGHIAGGGVGTPADNVFINKEISEFFAK